MKELVLLVGPQGSGKSTLCETEFADYYRISQDDQGKSEHKELLVRELGLGQNNSPMAAKGIVVDRINHLKGQRSYYLNLAKQHGYKTRIVVLHVPKEVAHKRIENRVGHPTLQAENAGKALDMFFKQYERPTEDEADVVEYRYDKISELPAIVVDIDGTLANVDHRLDFVRREGRKDWQSFFKEMVNDGVNGWCLDIIKAFRGKHLIVLCSGRPDNYRKETEEWLKKHEIPYDFLFMRQRSDSRKDSLIKENILDFELLTRFNIKFSVDDRAGVVEMWRRRGLTCLACAKGEF